MIYGFFSLLSFYVFFFHLIYLTVADYCSSFATQKLQFFASSIFVLCYNDFSQDKRLNFFVFLSLLDINLSPRANSVRHLKDSLIESYLTVVNPLFFLCKTKVIDHSMLDRLQGKASFFSLLR
ncbi:LOW QUALITY PROTEIN: hypothetical protein GLYMA_17G168100v4 [Glycine max]|uniref:Uncharacterized protein n=1 Tax=Glycine max TaxID=3847 RepID=K7MM24_SOYBN|nr:LOW QUALITY PROTEIN: hypothetical protein GLYMA_17G168100v4 [Glycine max]